MNTITKRDLVHRVAQRTHTMAIVVRPILQGCLDEVIATLAAGDRIELRDFGIFEPRIRPSRPGHNPRTGEEVHVPEKMRIRFKAGRLMKQALALDAQDALSASRTPTGSLRDTNSRPDGPSGALGAS